MKFRAHETFFIRKGWLYKGLKNVKNDPLVFMSKNYKPMDALGIGSNMVKSLRYWLQAVGLTKEPNSGKRMQSITKLGEIIYKYDPYIEEVGTLILLHYKLATNYELATSWFFFFNEFNLVEFTSDDFVSQLSAYIRMNNLEVSERSLNDDFNCIINTYVPRNILNPEKISPENNIDCPLGELNLIRIVDKSYKDSSGKKHILYKKNSIHKDSLNPYIVLAIILDNANDVKEINISTLINDNNNVCKVLNLNFISLLYVLNKIEKLGFIKIIRTAGLDIIKIQTELSFIDCIEIYYNSLD